MLNHVNMMPPVLVGEDSYVGIRIATFGKIFEIWYQYSMLAAAAGGGGAGEGVKCAFAGHDKNSPELCHAAMLLCQGDTTMLLFLGFPYYRLYLT